MPNFKRKKILANKQRISKYKQSLPTQPQPTETHRASSASAAKEINTKSVPTLVSVPESTHKDTITVKPAATQTQPANLPIKSHGRKPLLSASSYPASHETNTTGSSQISNKQQFRFVLITLLLALLTGGWLMQNSIQMYYQLTYHRNLAQNSIHETKIKTLLDLGIKQIQQELDQINQHITTHFNQKHVYTTAYQAKLQLEQQQQQHQARQAALLAHTRKLNKQAKIKADFTLNNTDHVFFAGDSLMQGVAPFVQKWLQEQHNINSINLSKQSTGLTYPGFFNWPQTIINTINDNPQIKMLVIYLGPNDPWDMPDPTGRKFLRFQSKPWEEIYRSRIRTIIQHAHQHQVTVFWLTPPDVRRSKLNQQMIYLRQVIQDEVQRNHGYIMDTRTLLGSRQNDQFNDGITDATGHKIKTRSADGIHFSVEGQKILANSILNHFHFAPNQ